MRVCLSKFSSQQAYDDIEQFFAKKDNSGYDRSLAQSLDSINVNTMWVDRDAQEVHQWLTQRGYLDNS